MLGPHTIQLIFLSIGVKAFSIFIYLNYYGGLLSTKLTATFEIEYDYIIVGSGTAGSLIAQRLATESKYSFIVIEAGGSSNPLFEIPVLGPMLHHSVYDWNFQTVPQDNACLAMNYKQCRLPQGKIIGGSSKLNNMVHVRGNISHYIEWFHGKYSENYIKKHFDFIESKILHLNELLYESELAEAIMEAAEELGYGTIDKNFKTGFRKSRLSQFNGKRWTTSDNLDLSKHVLSNALVANVIIENNEAIGVNIIILDKKHSIYAKKGVIISAGTYNSPKILQLSGIGPSNVLKSVKVPLIKDLPVGNNLQDHISTGLDLILFNHSLSVNPINMLNPFHMLEYFLKGKGPLTTAGCEVIGFLSTMESDVPDLQFMVIPVGLSADKGIHLRVAIGINDTIWDGYYSKLFHQHAATILPIVLHPKSKGEVYIISSDPKIPPNINPNYLSEKYDVDTLIRGLKLVKKFVLTKPIQQLGGFINNNHFPGCEQYVLFSDKYWECYVRHLTLTSYHPVGTCSMGFSSATSVVDTSFRVFGIENLYVVDASVMPTLPSGNINAAVAMIASVFFDENIKRLSFSQRVSKPLQCDLVDFFVEYSSKVCII